MKDGILLPNNNQSIDTLERVSRPKFQQQKQGKTNNIKEQGAVWNGESLRGRKGVGLDGRAGGEEQRGEEEGKL